VATFPPAALAYVAERVEPRRRVVAISAVTGAFLVSAVLLQIAAQVLVDVIGWRGLFALSAAGLVAAWLGLRAVMLPDGPAGSAGTPRPSGAGGSSRAGRSSGAVVWKELPAAYRMVPALLRDGALLLRYAATVVLMAGFVALYTGLQLHGVTASSGELLALRAAGLPAMITVPLLMGRLGRVAAPARAVAMLAAGALVLAATALTGAAGMGLVLLLAAYAATVTGGLPSLNEAVSGRAGQARGTALALFSFSLAVGAGVGPQVAAAFGGFTALLYGLAALMGVAALAVLASTRR
jgi:predicted MFS family arabinose efflux permease